MTASTPIAGERPLERREARFIDMMIAAGRDDGWIAARAGRPARLVRAYRNARRPRRRPGPPAVEAVLAAGEGACRWPLGDLHEPGFRYCGAPAAGRSDYCREHLGRRRAGAAEPVA
jgi:hypothetical protein